MELLRNLHPEIVHFPIALFFAYVLLEAIGILLKKKAFSNAATVILFIAVIFSVFAVLTGNSAEEYLKSFSPSREVLNIEEIHQTYATILMWYFTALLFLKIYFKTKKNLNFKRELIILILGILGLLFVYKTGEYGGKMVYDYGVGTKIFNGKIIK